MTTTAQADRQGTESRLIRLAEILEAEARLYEEMGTLAQDERRCLVAQDIDRLRRVVGEQEELIRRVDGLEIERREVVSEVAERLTGSSRVMTIGEILGAARGPERDRLRTLRERILAEISRIQKINDTNAYLIGSSLELVESELTLLARGDEVAYDGRGAAAAGEPRARLLDRRV